MGTVLQHVRDHALNWHKVKDDYEARHLELAEGAASAQELREMVLAALRELGDRHSDLIAPSTFRSRTQSLPTGEMHEGAAFITVPSYAANPDMDGAAFAATLTVAIHQLAGRQPSGWIVDLRTNSGGNMWPMLAGLAPLLGKGSVGAFAIPGRDEVHHWKIERGGAYLDNELTCPMPPSGAIEAVEGPIAVITGPKTISSGEAIAIAFRSWHRSKSFGLPTAGLSTSNVSFEMPDGWILAITSSVFADRSGKLYGAQIAPDLETPHVTSAKGSEDPAIAAALAWIREFDRF